MNELNDVLKNVQNKFIEILYHISEYNILFIDDKEMDNVIKDINSRFFYDLYWLYWNFITIRICAIMENKSTMGNDNLSIPKLIDLVENKDFKSVKEINIRKEKIINKLKPFKKARNKAFGHYDLKATINKTVFERLELDDLKIICDNIGEILNLIDNELGRTTKLYGARSSKGTMKLKHILKLGINKKNDLKKG